MHEQVLPTLQFQCEKDKLEKKLRQKEDAHTATIKEFEATMEKVNTVGGQKKVATRLYPFTKNGLALFNVTCLGVFLQFQEPVNNVCDYKLQIKSMKFICNTFHEN